VDGGRLLIRSDAFLYCLGRWRSPLCHPGTQDDRRNDPGSPLRRLARRRAAASAAGCHDRNPARANG